MERRRRVARYKAGWSGFCHVEGESPSGWRDCRVVDISMLGVGIRMQHLRPSDLPGSRVSVELPAVGDSINIRLEGTVKHVTRTALRATVRVGVEFSGLTHTERSILEALCGVRDDKVLALV
jgi:hypothetical protein